MLYTNILILVNCRDLVLPTHAINASPISAILKTGVTGACLRSSRGRLRLYVRRVVCAVRRCSARTAHAGARPSWTSRCPLCHEDKKYIHIIGCHIQPIAWRMVLLVVAGAFFVAAVLLLLHHCWKHAHDDPATSHAQQESCPEVCYFQRSDVCNFRTCSHEMWIVTFFVISWGCLVSYFYNK